MDYAPLMGSKQDRLTEIESIMGHEDFYAEPKRAAEVSQEYNTIKKTLACWDTFTESIANLEENRELVKSTDADLAEMAGEEIPELEKLIEKLEKDIQYALLPRDPTEARDAIVEIRAGTGGDEASLFAAELMRMYVRYAETVGWKVETMEASPSDVGGFKDVTIQVSGAEVFRGLKYESGVHRVQRVPATETQGRIHTSTATVAVLPEAEEVDIQLKKEELNVQTTRSGGPGGQHVNTTDTCVQVTHLPTGIMVKCSDGRSQPKNREKAFSILRAKLLEMKQREEAEKYSSQRRSLIGSGGREEKIRTYNFPQNRITDHRIGLTLYNLDAVMAGDISELVEKLQASEMEERLAEAGLG
ncbi:MAG: peptide chain release factor 1 [Verrucomicrobiales bacterium]|jgi:peptide chain release factor 1